MKNEKTEFSILLLTDIHSAESKLKSLVKQCKAMSYKPDYIISTGDHVTLYGGGQGDEELVKKAEKETSSAVSDSTVAFDWLCLSISSFSSI